MVNDERARLESLVQTAVDGIMTIDEFGIIETMNAAATRLFGYGTGEVIGERVTVLIPAAFGRNPVDRRARNQSPIDKERSGACRDVVGRRQDGSTFPLRLAMGEFRLGQRRMFTAVVRDLTAEQQAEQRMLQAERLAAMGQMLSVLSHESRNAMQISQANLELLALELPEQSDLMDYVARIQSSQERLRCLFDELRTFADPMVLDCEACNVNRIVDRALGQLREAGLDKRVNVHSEFQSGNLRCAVDQNRMERVFRNLLDNSLAVCPDPVTIRALWSDGNIEDDDALELRLCDNGPGLPAELQQKVFEPFFTTKPQGIGLGMAISKRIVESHGGRIAVGNNGHAGAEFIITLPRKQHVAA